MTFTDRNTSTQRALLVVALGFLALALTYSARAVLGLAMPLWETEPGWSRSYVSNVVARALLVMALVAPVAGYMLDRKGLRLTLLFGLFAVIFGAVDYSTVPVTTSLVASHLGLRVVGFVMGLLTAGHQIGAAIGASLGGYFYATDSSYDLVWISSTGLTAIAGTLAFLLKTQPPANNAAFA